jgi:hypothetical protein
LVHAHSEQYKTKTYVYLTLELWRRLRDIMWNRWCFYIYHAGMVKLAVKISGCFI